MRANEDGIPQRTCKECGETYDADVFFGRNHARKRRGEICISRQAVCKLCRQTARDKKKYEDPWYLKAKNAYRSHGRKLTRQGKIAHSSELRTKYGWSVARIEHDMRHHWENGCQYCQKPFQGMPNGMGELTVDIHNPKEAPYYPDNIKYICWTCNAAKGLMTPSQFARYRRMSARWQKRQGAINAGIAPGMQHSFEFTKNASA